jgi:hypothetical protein
LVFQILDCIGANLPASTCFQCKSEEDCLSAVVLCAKNHQIVQHLFDNLNCEGKFDVDLVLICF